MTRGLVVAAAGLLLCGLVACGDDDDDADAPDAPDEQEAEGLLGPEDEATGEPVRIGMVSDGATQAFDNTDELRSAQATAEFWNTHRGGVGGRPIEVVTCETGADPAGATDCANQLVEEGVVAVAMSQSAVGPAVWEGLHSAGVPTLFFQANGGAEMMTDDQTTFNIFNPVTTLFGVPISAAEAEDADKIAFVVIDVPQALTAFETEGPELLESAGLDYEVIKVAPGTADMTSQMQQVADSGAGVVQVVGNDAFCIAAFQGLNTVGYEGVVTTITQCITDATREALPGDVLDGIQILSTQALGATDDPTFQLYEAVMSAFGDDVEDIQNATAMGGYIAMSALTTALEGISGDITPETIAETIKAMPEQDLPGGGGITYRCGGSASAAMASVCTNQFLRTTLDGEGRPRDYEVFDPTDILPS